MAKAVKNESKKQSDDDELTTSLITDLNKQFGHRVAFNLAFDDNPTDVKNWLPSSSLQLDYAIRNASGGGYPEGRIIEISGVPSAGKSHLGYAAAAECQRRGGLVVYVDSEVATPVQKLAQMGIDVKKRFVYATASCTEECLAIIESTILKAKQVNKDVPILVVWDSLAACSPKQELEGEYDQNTVGLQARVVSKGMRKIVGLIGSNRVTLIVINQLRSAIGNVHGDPFVEPGGKGVAYAASVRIRLTSNTQVKDKGGNIIGSHVIATIKKNKLAPPWRKLEFNIIFGKGIDEDEYIFDEVRSHCDANGPVVRDGKSIMISGSSAWKELLVTDVETGEVLVSKKFTKSQFGELMRSSEHGQHVMTVVDAAYTQVFDSTSGASDGSSSVDGSDSDDDDSGPEE